MKCTKEGPITGIRRFIQVISSLYWFSKCKIFIYLLTSKHFFPKGQEACLGTTWIRPLLPSVTADLPLSGLVLCYSACTLPNVKLRYESKNSPPQLCGLALPNICSHYASCLLHFFKPRIVLSLCFQMGILMKFKKGTCFVALSLPGFPKPPTFMGDHLWFPLTVQLPAPNQQKVCNHCPCLARPSAWLGIYARVTLCFRLLKGYFWFTGSGLPPFSLSFWGFFGGSREGDLVVPCLVFSILNPCDPFLYF